MPDYSRGKIYRITSGDLTYIGSTCEPTLAKRLSKHVSDYKSWKAGKKNNIRSFQVIATGQYEITLVELVPCGSKDELTARERYHIENTVCVNRCVTGRTRKEYRDANKEVIVERSKTYYEANREALLEKKKTYYETNKEAILEYKQKRYYEQKI